VPRRPFAAVLTTLTFLLGVPSGIALAAPAAAAVAATPTSTTPLVQGDAGADPFGRPAPQPEPRTERPAEVTPATVHSWWSLGGFTALVVVSLLLTGVAGTTLAWMLHAWRTPQHLEATRFSRTPGTGRRPRFSLLVPARHEEDVLGETLDRLAAVEYDDVEILAIVGHDDPGTEAVARAASTRHPDRVRVVVDHSVPKNKPKALNTALLEVTGDVVGVMDAEDEVHPHLLSNVADRFAETRADVVQGGVQLMNLHSSWWSLRNVLEYYFWFRSRLHFHAGAKFIPLGGNTVFLRTHLLKTLDGWDAECLAEDCELGVRLSSRGYSVVVAYDPELVTREETPPTLRSLVKQRTRWCQGFLQVLRKGIWRELPSRRQRWLARYTLSMPFLQAFTGLLIPFSIAMVLFAKVPTWVSLLSFVPLVPTVVTMAVELAGLLEFGRAYSVRIRVRDVLGLLLGTFPYQVVLAVAAVRAVIREAQGDSSWEKTEHTGAHRTPATEVDVRTASVDLVTDRQTA